MFLQNKAFGESNLPFDIFYSSNFVKALPQVFEFFSLSSFLLAGRKQYEERLFQMVFQWLIGFVVITMVWQLKRRLSEGHFWKAQLTRSILPNTPNEINSEPWFPNFILPQPKTQKSLHSSYFIGWCWWLHSHEVLLSCDMQNPTSSTSKARNENSPEFKF